jgi:hypothetical protein
MVIDTHLMISEPGRYAVEFVKAGADMVSVHVEADASSPSNVVIYKGSRRIGRHRDQPGNAARVPWTKHCNMPISCF